MEKRKTEWRKQLQSSFTLLENFPKSIFYMLYTIWKLRKSRIQRFKPCMIWSWNEEDMAFGRQLHHVKWPISQCEFHIAKISQGDFLHGAKFCHFAMWISHCENFARWINSWCENMALRIMSNSHCENFAMWNSHCEIPLNPLFLHARTTDFPNIFSLIFSHVNSFCNLVFSRHKALSCNFAIYRGAQHLQQKMGWLGDRSSVH